MVVALAVVGTRAHADWLAPDASFRDAQMQLRYATRDTVGHGEDLARIDTLAVALLRIGRIREAQLLFTRVLAARPGDAAASAALGKLALWAGRDAAAESLLVAAGDTDQARADLYALRLRTRQWSAAAAMAAEMGEEGRQLLFERLAEGPAMQVQGQRAQVPFERLWPAPLVKVRLNGALVIMMVDTGLPGLLLDKDATAQQRVTPVGGQRLALWGGTRVAVRNAIAQRLEIGGVAFTNVPAGVLSLHKFSLEVNPQATPIAGVIGLDLLRRFDVTFDYHRRALVLEPLGHAAKLVGTRVPFEEWGEGELTVWGSLNGGRRMALMFATGMAGGGVGAPDVVFEELGLKSGGVSKIVKGAGVWLQGRAWLPVNVPSLSLGQAVFDKQLGWSGAMDALELWRHGVRRDALLGPGLLIGRRTTLDWTKRELVFEDD